MDIIPRKKQCIPYRQSVICYEDYCKGYDECYETFMNLLKKYKLFWLINIIEREKDEKI